MGGGTFTNFNVDAVDEIRASSGWMPAEIRRGAAGFTDIIARAGSKTLHGSVFEFLRNAALNARNFFDRHSFVNPRRIPPFIRNEFGFTIGGPFTHFADRRFTISTLHSSRTRRSVCDPVPSAPPFNSTASFSMCLIS
jgi:hypothetical protein